MVVKDGDPKALVIRTASGAQDRVRIVIELSNLAVLVTELLKRAPPFRADGRVNVSWNDLDRAHVTFPKTKNGDAGVPLHPRVGAALSLLKHRDGEVFRRPEGKPYSRPGRPRQSCQCPRKGAKTRPVRFVWIVPSASERPDDQ
jgi:hypothetical protein